MKWRGKGEEPTNRIKVKRVKAREKKGINRNVVILGGVLHGNIHGTGVT